MTLKIPKIDRKFLIIKEPFIYKIIGVNKKKIQIIISLRASLKIKTAGLINKDIQNKLKAYVPITDIICNISGWLKKLKAIKFQGKPVKIKPLKNSIKPKRRENEKNKLTIFFNFKKNRKKVTKP